jgi:LPS export ABC transporter protein LptC
MIHPGKKKQILFLVLMLVVLAGGVAGFFVINRVMETPPVLKDIHIDSEAALKLNLMKQISKKNGITEWELEATTATLVKEKDQAVLTDVRVIFYTKDDTRVFLTSDQGTLNTETHDMDFAGNVVVRHQTYTLKTDQLHYKKKPHIIHADTRVRLENTNSAMEADTMEIQLKENNVILQGHVKGQFSEDFNLL